MKYIKYLSYLSIALHVSSSFAGSYDDFFAAIRADNVEAVDGLLKRGFDPNTQDPKGQPGVTVALQVQAHRVAQALLARSDLDVNALNAARESPLMMAALKGDLSAAQRLLDRGAKVDLTGWGPLHYAATGPEPKLVQLLLDRGASIDAESPNGTTPLMMAAQYGSEDSVRILLERGANPKRRNQLNLGPVEFAKLGGREALAKRLESVAR